MNADTVAAVVDALPLHNVTVLCVEDVKEARNFLAIFLSRQGATVIEAENGEQGLRLFDLHRPDIVISDIGMPIMDGVTMCRAIRADHADVPIILLTAYSEAELLQEAISMGVIQYIIKPVRVDKLFAALVSALEKIHAQKAMSKLQEAVSEYRNEENRLHNYVTQIVGSDQHVAVKVLSRPRQLISGDFYCIEATEHSLYVMLADGMGHGLSAILPALDLPRKFRELAAQEFSLARIADELNQLLCQQRLSEHFVVATMVRMDAKRQLIEVINCGNPPVLLVDNNGMPICEFPSNHLAFGIVADDEFMPELQSVRCAIPAKLYLYSDGLPETLSRGEINPDEALSKLMGRPHDEALLDSVAALLKQVPEHLHHDDVTLLELMFDPEPSDIHETALPGLAAIKGLLYDPLQKDYGNPLKWLSVLYVEDDLDALENLSAFLSRRVGVLYAADSAEKGLHLFRKYRPQLVITDMVMPNMNGLQMVQQIRLEDPSIPVILVSGVASWQSQIPQIETLLDMNISKFLSKPFDADKLLETIRQCVKRYEYLKTLKLSSSVFMTSPLAITITDRDRKVISINPAFTEITGYTLAEIVGCNPRVLSSGKHNSEFYAGMWESLNQTGRWSGEIWNRRKNGELFLEWINISVIRNYDGEITHYASVFADITQRTAAEEKLRHLAHHDALTNLPNRVLLQDRLNQALLQAHREASKLAVVYVDIDHFKNLNDSMGHGVGDELIVGVAKALQSVVREVDTVSRLGGDEFAVLLPDVGSHEMAARLVGKIFNAVGKTYLIAGRELRITASMGVSLFPRDGDNPTTLLKHADSAMYLAKKEGRNNFQFFDEALESQTERYMLIQHGLHNALKLGEFSIHYQPKYALDRMKVVGAEALLRWNSPILGAVSPAEFIPIAEETGFIVDIGCWLIEKVCQTMAAWKARGAQLVPVAINISPIQFHRGNLDRTLLQAIINYRIDPRLIQIELTEGVVMNRQLSTINLLQSIKKRGIAISIDDFGTGFSSLSYLRQLPIDELKIDRSFIMEITDEISLTDSRLTAIPLAVIDLARNLNLKLVAEGVETQIQSNFLQKNGCNVIQGYLFSKPVVKEEMLDLLDKR